MYINNKILVGKNDSASCELLLSKANRHGLITGATGSGKTVTVKVLAESFSDAGVPVFLADVKGDLAGCASIGEANDKINERINKLNLEGFYFESYPVHFWDLFGMKGHPVRVKVSDVGSEILSIMLGLSETQEGVLAIVFKIAKDENFKLVDLKDLRAALQYVGDNRKKYATSYGNVTIQSIGGIQRSLLILENQGANNFFGEPSLDIKDFIRCSSDGRGIINILDAVELFKSPDLYASFLLWLLTSLYNTLEEVGDLDKPKIVFFFDEAHLLFNNMPAYRLKQITRIVKLIRSKGIGLYFISQGPTDIPDDISGQLANRIQHSLHAYTPSEMRVVTAAADSFRTNPSFNTKDAILELGTGEALVSFIDEKGLPNIVEKVTILPPQSKIGTIDDLTRNKVINSSEFAGKYDVKIDSESAYDTITKKTQDNFASQDEVENLDDLTETEKFQRKMKQEDENLEGLTETEKFQRKMKMEKETKNKKDPVDRIGRKVTTQVENTLIRKSVNKIINGLFK